MSQQLAFTRFGRHAFAAVGQAWSRIWFQSKPTSPLEITRMGVAAALLVNYGLAIPYLFLFWGDEGWMPRAILFDDTIDPWAQSIFFYFTAPWQWVAFHAFFLLCCAALMLGWRTSWLKWIVLIGQISFAYRNPVSWYGVDKILACLLVILCLAPIGRAMSLDRVRAVRAAKSAALQPRCRATPVRGPAPASV